MMWRKATSCVGRSDVTRILAAVGWILFAGLCQGCPSRSGSDGPPRTATLSVRPGPNSPVSVQALPGSTDVVILQVRLESPDADIEVDSLRFGGSGTGDDAAGLQGAQLFRDTNSDGVVDPGDIVVGSPSNFSSDDGDLNLSGLAQIIPTGGTADLLLVYDIGSGALLGETFCAAIADGSDVGATSTGRRVLVEVDPGLRGCATVIAGTLTVSAGPAPPPVRVFSQCGTTEPVLQIQLVAGAAEDILVDSVRLTASGTGDDWTDVDGVRLYLDVNADGVVDPADVRLRGPEWFLVDDGTVTFSGLGRLIPGGGGEAWLVTYELPGAVAPGATYACHLVANADLSALGATSGQAASVTGAPVNGNAVTADSTDPGLLSATYTDVNENGIRDYWDTIVLVFSKEVVIFGGQAGQTFDLDPPSPASAWGWPLQGVVPTEVIIYPETSLADFQPNGTYGSTPTSTGINIQAGQSRLRTCANTFLQPQPGFIDIAGEFAPHVLRADFQDSDSNCLPGAGDSLQVTFTENVTFGTTDPGQALQLLVAGDSFGAGAQITSGTTDVRSVTVTLGTAPVLTLLGLFDPATAIAGSPSGIDLAPAGPVVCASFPSVSARTLNPAGLDIGTASSWFSSGDDQADAWMGYSVGSCDLNNDGYGDVIVGALGFDGVSPNTGKVYVYHGGPGGLSPTPDWTSSGDGQAEQFFGASVSGAGDVNGDGYDDVLIGCSGYDTANTNAGKAYIYFGGPSGLGAIEDWSASGTDTPGLRFGYSGASAGDVNDDGYDDVIIGTYSQWAFVYLGGVGGPSPGFAWASAGDGPALNLQFGRAVSGAGDVNGDGFDDVVVGDARNDTGPYETGKIFVFFGNPGGLSASADWTSTGEDGYRCQFGGAVGSAGDVNGDGYSDIIVGAQSFNAQGSYTGKAYLFAGGPAGPSSNPLWTSRGDDQVFAQYGRALAPLGDVDVDGYDDVAIAAPFVEGPKGASRVGKVYVYRGYPGGLSATPVWTVMPQPPQYAEFGGALASGSDVNGDGSLELLVGALRFGTSNPEAGRVFLFPLCR